jgi:uncharacterized protein (DUF2336 family)
MQAQVSLIQELEEAVRVGSHEKRVDTLRRVTDVFLGGADRFSDEQIGVFDDVLVRLIDTIEAKALHQLSERLAPLESAPTQAIRRLAWHSEVSVAGPVLAHSSRLTSSDLVEIASTQSQGHLLAISGRARLDESVTDVLAHRGDSEVVQKLAANQGARLSQSGFAELTERAENDESLAQGLARRVDIPLEMLSDLLARATEAVRSRLLACVSLEREAEVRIALAMVSKKVRTIISRDYTEAQHAVSLMQRARKLNEPAVFQFAVAQRYQHVVAAIAALCSMPIELIDRLMHGTEFRAILVPCKAAGFEWATVRSILRMLAMAHAFGDQHFEQIRADYAKLSIATAQRALRFWKVRETATSQIAS